MDRTSWIAVIVLVVGALAFHQYVTTTYPPAPPEEQAEQAQEGGTTETGDDGEETADTQPAEETETEVPSTNATAQTGEAGDDMAVTAPAEPEEEDDTAAEPEVEEVTTKLINPAAIFHFTNHGGGIARAELLRHTTLRSLHGKNGDDADDADETAEGEEATGEDGDISIIMNEYGRIPVGTVAVEPRPAKLPVFDLVQSTSDTIVYERNMTDTLVMRKTYQMAPELEGMPEDREGRYLLNLKIEFINNGEIQQGSKPYYLHLGEEEEIYPTDQDIYTTYQWMSQKNADSIHVRWFEGGRIPLVGIETRAPSETFTKAPEGGVKWAAVNNQFFSILAAPEEPRGESLWAQREEVEGRWDGVQDGKTSYAIHGAIQMPGVLLEPGETVAHTFRIYTGPKEYNRLARLPDGEQEILNFGFLSPVSVLLLKSMNFFERFLHSYALAIIAITVCLKILLWPLQTKAMRSMKRMSDQMKVMQPKMEALKTKYKDNPQKMNEEMAKLYKEHNINPMGGCLPSLLQLPIFLGFFYMLRTAVELRNESFLWVEDLSRPDTIATLGFIPINPLPIIMTICMVIYMSLQPTTANNAQQKIMRFMPIIFLVFCYNFASALSLYWTTQNLLSIVQFFLTKDIRDGDKPKDKDAAKGKNAAPSAGGEGSEADSAAERQRVKAKPGATAARAKAAQQAKAQAKQARQQAKNQRGKRRR